MTGWLEANGITALFAVLILVGAAVGARRRFGPQLGALVLQVGYLVAAGLAVWLAWRWVTAIARRIAGWDPHVWPDWLNHAVSVWQSAPQAARLIAFLVLFFAVSALLRAGVWPLARLLVRALPRAISNSAVFGAVAGAAAGLIRCALLGAVCFGLLHYFALPSLQRAALQSPPYRFASARFYQPYLGPVLTKELPVLGDGAMATLSQNISLFAVPTGKANSQRGVLLVPRQIAALAHQITAGDTTDVAKAHALYEWEIHHVRYDWTKYWDYVDRGQWDAQSPLETVETGKGVCADYALLYADLAHASGLTVQIDEGVGGTPSDSGPHAWNEVWDAEHGRWIPVDTTWGATQDAWFDAPNFDATHHLQTSILITGGRG
ncbi:MAG: transglutaminase domain-containing protein [Alicyclobacillus sp.]|nr:transglutaminase domain-containing protein [Alicyclobacillus sp.]